MSVTGKLFVKKPGDDEGLEMLQKLVKEAIANDPHVKQVEVISEYSFELYREALTGRTLVQRRAKNKIRYEGVVRIAPGTILHLFGLKRDGIFFSKPQRIFFDHEDGSMVVNFRTRIVQHWSHPIGHDAAPEASIVTFKD